MILFRAAILGLLTLVPPAFAQEAAPSADTDSIFGQTPPPAGSGPQGIQTETPAAPSRAPAPPPEPEPAPEIAEPEPTGPERMIGAIACVPPEPFLPAHHAEASETSRRIGVVPTGNCYPTAGCEGGWCAVETVNGMGWVVNRGVSIVIPQVETSRPRDTGCGMFVLLGSEPTRDAAEAHISQMYGAEQAVVLDNDRLPNLPNGAFTMAIGPFGSREAAQQAAQQVSDRAEQTQVRAACLTP